MKSLFILVMMQLKEQMNFKRFQVENVKAFHILLSAVGSIIKFSAVTGLCYGFLYLLAKYIPFLLKLAYCPGCVKTLRIEFGYLGSFNLFSTT